MGQDWIWVWRLALARSLLLGGNDLWQTAFLGTHTQGTHPIFYLLGIRRDKTHKPHFAGRDHLRFTDIREIDIITWKSIISWLQDRLMLSG